MPVAGGPGYAPGGSVPADGGKPFVVVVGEPAIRDALAGCNDLVVFGQSYPDAASFLAALGSEIPTGVDNSVVLVSDQVKVADGVSFVGIVQSLRPVAVALCWRSRPDTLAAYVPVVTPPISLGILRQAISVKSGIALPGGGDEPIHVPGLQEAAPPVPVQPATGLGGVVADLASVLGTSAPAAPPPGSEVGPPAHIPSADVLPPDGGDSFDKLVQLVGDIEPPSSGYPPAWAQPVKSPPPPAQWTAIPGQVSPQAPVQVPVAEATPPPISSLDPSVMAPNGAGPVQAVGPAVAPRRLARISRVMAVWSSKGGVGKTTVALNLAARVAATGLSVLVMDLDLDSADVAARLQIKDPLTISDLLRNDEPLTRDRLLHSLPVSPTTGVALLLPPFDLGHAIGGRFTVGTYERVLAAATGAYDLVVLDCGAGAGDDLAVRFALPKADSVCLVIDNEGAALVALRRTLMHVVEVEKRLSWNQFGIVVNQCVEGRGGYSLRDIAGWFQQVRVVGTMPDARAEILAAQARGQMAVSDAGPVGVAMRSMIDGAITALIPEIGELLTSQGAQSGPMGGLTRGGSRQGRVGGMLDRLFTKRGP